MFSAEEEELPALLPEERLSLEDLEDEDEREEEMTDILDEEGPTDLSEASKDKD